MEKEQENAQEALGPRGALCQGNRVTKRVTKAVTKPVTKQSQLSPGRRAAAREFQREFAVGIQPLGQGRAGQGPLE